MHPLKSRTFANWIEVLVITKLRELKLLKK
jgi:hypothetical protein